MILVCHVIKGSCDFMGRNPSKINYRLPKFDDQRRCDKKDTMILVSHVIL